MWLYSLALLIETLAVACCLSCKFICAQGLKVNFVLSSYLWKFHTVPSLARCSSTMAAVNGPLNFINGQRVESTNSNTDDDVTVLEPATGY